MGKDIKYFWVLGIIFCFPKERFAGKKIRQKKKAKSGRIWSRQIDWKEMLSVGNKIQNSWQSAVGKMTRNEIFITLTSSTIF
jgi:hypothetical protein